MGNTVTKNWTVTVDDIEYVVQLRHHTFSGRRSVYINDKLV